MCLYTTACGMDAPDDHRSNRRKAEGMRQPRARATSRASIAGLALFGALAGGLVFSGAPALAVLPEAPVTEPAIPITGTEATLNGELNPGSSATAGYEFTYNTNGTCTEGPTTEPGAEATGEHIKVSTPLTGLEALTPYTFCVVATHTEAGVTELAPGLPLTFETLASSPVVVSESSSGVTPFAATLEAQVNPENQATTSCRVEYGLSTAYEAGSAPCEPSSINGAAEQRVSATVSGLQAATIYHYRVVVNNATGETKGVDAEFTTLTLEKPIVGSESSSPVTSTGATLGAVVNPNYQETTYSFKYALNEALTEGAVTVAGAGPLAAKFAELPVSVNTGILAPRTTYFYRASGTNETGTTEAATVEHFTTLATPLVTTGAASNITRTSAALSGTVNPGGVPTTYHFAYVAATEYESLAANPYAKGGSTSDNSVGSDYTVHAVGPLGISELKPGVTYHYALVATNSVGTEIGPDVEFTTSPPTRPIATTGSAGGVTQLAASINGSVDTRGLPTISQFEFGTTPYAESLQPATITSSSGSVETISTSFNNDLQPGTTYYYRVVASSQDGTSYGAEQSFTTGSFPGLPGVSAVQILGWPAFVAETAARTAREALEGTNTGPPSKPLTKAQKLAKALKACGKKPKKQRASCRRQAKKRYR
jgi:hypothetical protein